MKRSLVATALAVGALGGGTTACHKRPPASPDAAEASAPEPQATTDTEDAEAADAPPPAPCGATLPKDYPKVTKVPPGWLLRALVPGADVDSLRPPPGTESQIAACAGITLDATEEPPDMRLDVVRRTLREDKGAPQRLAVWVVVHHGGTGLGDDYTGMLAIVRIEGRELVVDAVGEWSNNAAPGRLESHLLAERAVRVEPQGKTEGAGSSTKMTVWVERNGRLERAGEYPASECVFQTPENGGEDDLACFTTKKTSWDDALHLEGSMTLDDQYAHRLRATTAKRRFVLEDDKLVEDPPFAWLAGH